MIIYITQHRKSVRKQINNNMENKELLQEIIGLSKGHKDYIKKLLDDYKASSDVIKYYIETKMGVLSKEIDDCKKDHLLREIELSHKELQELSNTLQANIEIAKATYIAQIAEKYISL
jgi:hypothetical protein